MRESSRGRARPRTGAAGGGTRAHDAAPRASPAPGGVRRIHRSALDEERQRTTRLNNARRAKHDWNFRAAQPGREAAPRARRARRSSHSTSEQLVLPGWRSFSPTPRRASSSRKPTRTATASSTSSAPEGFENDPTRLRRRRSASPGGHRPRPDGPRGRARSTRRGPHGRRPARSTTSSPSPSTSPTSSTARCIARTRRRLRRVRRRGAAGARRPRRRGAGHSRLHGELRTAYLATVRAARRRDRGQGPVPARALRGGRRATRPPSPPARPRARQREELLFGSLLHDVGKIGISERILLKPGRLTTRSATSSSCTRASGYRLVGRHPGAAGHRPGDPAPPRALRRRRATPPACAASRSRSRRASSAWPTRSAR